MKSQHWIERLNRAGSVQEGFDIYEEILRSCGLSSRAFGAFLSFPPGYRHNPVHDERPELYCIAAHVLCYYQHKNSHIARAFLKGVREDNTCHEDKIGFFFQRAIMLYPDVACMFLDLNVARGMNCLNAALGCFFNFAPSMLEPKHIAFFGKLVAAGVDLDQPCGAGVSSEYTSGRNTFRTLVEHSGEPSLINCLNRPVVGCGRTIKSAEKRNVAPVGAMTKAVVFAFRSIESNIIHPDSLGKKKQDPYCTVRIGTGKNSAGKISHSAVLKRQFVNDIEAICPVASGCARGSGGLDNEVTLKRVFSKKGKPTKWLDVTMSEGMLTELSNCRGV